MSEQILKALMQLFAIIARPEGRSKDRRVIVENILKKQLNQELVAEYLKEFDRYCAIHQDRQKETDKLKKRTSASSVRILVICTEINEELTQNQKVIVLDQLLEFVKSDNHQTDEITEQEFAFISTVADTFNIPEIEYKRIKSFVLNPFEQVPNSSKIAVIDNNRDFVSEKTKHIYSEFLEGQIRILNVASTNMYLIRYIGKSEMYMNGQLLQHDKVYVFNIGASIRNPQITPIYYSDIVGILNEATFNSKITLEVNHLEYKFSNGKQAIHKLDFSEKSGKLVGIMGASGAGKSTLLNVLNGSEKPTKGEVLINGINIHTDKNKIEGLIGYVSQDDLLIEELTVYQNLYYNAKLCFSNYSGQQIDEAVNKMLENLGLLEIKDTQVGNPFHKKISGGQRKRLNIALELIREPSVLFLDEPTSGLSSRDSENIMDLLKELSLRGKLVFVVIHQPSSDIFKMFDRLLILDYGGYLIYNGNPIDSIIYFKSRVHQANCNESECHSCGNVNPEQIFNIVEAHVLDEEGKITHTRKISPKEWNEFYNKYQKSNRKPLTAVKKIPEISFKIPHWFNQFRVFIKRDVLSKLANKQYLVINLLETPILAFLLSYIIKYRNVNITNKFGYTFNDNSNLPVYIFMSVIVAIFIGLTVSAEEIIKDRKIRKRETFLNLSWSAYLMSKIFVLLVISAIQSFLFVVIGNSIIEVKGMFLEYWLILFSTWVAANLMGLVISDSFKTVVTIYILIPFLVIPQIILSGVLVKYEKINPSISSPENIPLYGEIIIARWAYEALAVYQFKENRYEKPLYKYDKAMSIAEYKRTYWIKNLRNKVDEFEENPDLDKKKVTDNFITLKNEISQENSANQLIQYKGINQLGQGYPDEKTLKKLKSYLDELNNYYIELYNKANAEKDKLISSFQTTEKQKQEFLKIKREYDNESLRELVTNSNETDRIVEYHHHLYQKIDPVFYDSPDKFIKAHFYAPRKQIMGAYLSTFVINLIIIWLITVLFYVALYFRWLKKLLFLFGPEKKEHSSY
ncbi:MAG: ATP-binding cassette domain-containing protein [Bacteroidota bacterium]|nr:ATP-binding cassette domain-containing protein [Bacteroidota bacterium]